MKKMLALLPALAFLVPTMASAGERIMLRNAETGAEYGPVEIANGASIEVGETTLVVETMGRTTAQLSFVDKLKSINVPRVNFREAPIRDAMTFLATASSEHDSRKKGVNIVVATPSREEASLPMLTLELRSVSLYDALLYSCEVTGLRMRIDDNAVVITR